MYPEPIDDSEFIIEPFAGSAAYSLCGSRWEKQVMLYDTNNIVCSIWRYLLQASVSDIEKLPDLSYHEDLRDYTSLSEEEAWMIGFAINPGSPIPKNIVQKFSRWSANKKYIIDNLYKIKHWQIYEQSFETAPNIKATWFIDPPYFKEGKYYGATIDYSSLAEWCHERLGLKIVCEGETGAWLPFEKLCQMSAIGKRKPNEFVYIETR